MKQKRVRLGIKFLDGQFIELFNARLHKDGWIMWAPGSDEHITTIKEADAITSHVTHQKEDRRKPLGRLLTNVDVDEEKLFTDLFNPRKLEKKEYDKIIFGVNKNFQNIWGNTKLDMETEETDKEILKYVDLRRVFEKAQEIVEKIQETRQLPFMLYNAQDILTREDIEIGVTENQLCVIENDGELWEFDPKYMYQLGNKDHPWSDYLKPLGVFEILKDVDEVFSKVTRQLEK